MRQLLFTLMLLLASVGGHAQHAKEKATMEDLRTGQKALVAFFSRADENYAVGYIEKGNTHIVAEMIAARTGADLFRIETVKPYPASYDSCIEVARREKQSDARPPVKGDIRVEDYDVIYLGYPNWWGEMPRRSIPSSRSTTGRARRLFPSVRTRAAGFRRQNGAFSRPAPAGRC